jgi:hypothetical protein
MFCDQTSDTARKVANRSTQNGARRTSQSSGTKEEQRITPTISQELPSISIDEFALLYCRYHHVVRLPESNKCLNLVDAKLLHCLRALGAASYSTTIQCPRIAFQGRQYYISAIQLLNKDLASPTEAVKDNALLTVISLSYYESVSGSSWRSLTAWSQHIQGIAALIELRGPGQLQTAAGRLLFHQATACLVFDCLRMSIRLPYCIHDMIKLLTNEIEDPTDPPWRVHLALIDLVELKAGLYENLIQDPQDAIYRFQKIDEDLRAAFFDVSPIWGYEVRPSTSNSFSSCLPEKSHIYTSAIAAQLRNAARNARIICHGLIVCVLKQSASVISPKRIATLLKEAHQVMYQLQMEILASVPQHLGLEDTPTYERYCPSANDDGPQCPTKDVYQVANTSTVLPVLRLPHHYIFMWNILMAGEVSPLGAPQRKAICDILRYAGQRVGMAQAFIFAKALEENKHASTALGARTAMYESTPQ